MAASSVADPAPFAAAACDGLIGAGIAASGLRFAAADKGGLTSTGAGATAPVIDGASAGAGAIIGLALAHRRRRASRVDLGAPSGAVGGRGRRRGQVAVATVIAASMAAGAGSGASTRSIVKAAVAGSCCANIGGGAERILGVDTKRSCEARNSAAAPRPNTTSDIDNTTAANRKRSPGSISLVPLRRGEDSVSKRERGDNADTVDSAASTATRIRAIRE